MAKILKSKLVGTVQRNGYRFRRPIHGKYPLYDSELNASDTSEPLEPVQWAEKEWLLTTIYAEHGTQFRARPWQRFVINLILWWRHINLLAPVRTGKTMLADIMRGYCIDTWDMGGAVFFPIHDLAELNFQKRIIPAIKDIPVLRQYWSGRDDDLSMRNLTLKNCMWGIGSAGNKNDLSAFGYQFVLGDEVAKWPEKEFDAAGMISGRQEDYKAIGLYRRVYCSSPWEVGDRYYREIYKPGVLIVSPHVPCPHCGKYFEFSDSHIREIKPDDEKLLHSPSRIRELKEAAVRYECPHCSQEIKEDQHLSLCDQAIWKAPKIEFKGFKQEAIDIPQDIKPDGPFAKYDTITCTWNRLIDHTFTFWECLARFFESLRAPDKRRKYETEDMARFYKPDSMRRSVEYLMSKRFGYSQYGPDAFVPDGVVLIECTMDTQDNGFYYRFRGWGLNLETWLIRHDFIETPMDEKGQNKAEVLRIVREHLDAPLLKRDGTRMYPWFGLVDRGGHRAPYVDYLCEHIWWLNCYVGSAHLDDKKSIIEQSKSKDVQKLWIGQTERLSEIFDARMLLKTWHLPDDVTDEYMSQVIAQHWETGVDAHGRPKRIFVTSPKDHYRDTENYGEAIVKILALEDRLITVEGCRMVDEHNKLLCKRIETPAAPVEQTEKKTEHNRPDRGPQRQGPQGSWLSTLRRR